MSPYYAFLNNLPLKGKFLVPALDGIVAVVEGFDLFFYEADAGIDEQ